MPDLSFSAPTGTKNAWCPSFRYGCTFCAPFGCIFCASLRHFLRHVYHCLRQIDVWLARGYFLCQLAREMTFFALTGYHAWLARCIFCVNGMAASRGGIFCAKRTAGGMHFSCQLHFCAQRGSRGDIFCAKGGSGGYIFCANGSRNVIFCAKGSSEVAFFVPTIRMRIFCAAREGAFFVPTG